MKVLLVSALLSGFVGASTVFRETFSVASLDETSFVASGEETYANGVWELGSGKQGASLIGEQGLVVKSTDRHAISAKFEKPLVPNGKGLVVQYEVRLHQDLQCGGAYLKVLQDTLEFDPLSFQENTPYIIMFGPDKCGTTNKVHFIFRHKSPKTGKFEEKHLASPPSIKNDRKTHLYTLVVKPDNTYEILIDQKSVQMGSLNEDFVPTVNPPTRIDDPEDFKPEDWVDAKKIRDQSVSKPEDWDEDAPKEIADPEAERPDDWDDDSDGEYEPPMIPNPNHKGKWSPSWIDNPAYKGEWKPKQIENPDYFEDGNPHALSAMGGVGFEILTWQDDIEFDNIFIGHEYDEAKAFADETWAEKRDAEKSVAGSSENDDSDFDFQEIVDEITEFSRENPIPVILSIVAVFVSTYFLTSICGAGSDDEFVDDEEDDEKDDDGEDEEEEEEEGEGDDDDA